MMIIAPTEKIDTKRPLITENEDPIGILDFDLYAFVLALALALHMLQLPTKTPSAKTKENTIGFLIFQ